MAKSTSKRHPEYFFYFPKTDGNVEAINSVFKLRKADILRLVAGNDDMFNKYVNDAVIMVTRRVWGSRSIYAFNESSSYLGYVASNNSLKSVSLKAAQDLKTELDRKIEEMKLVQIPINDPHHPFSRIVPSIPVIS